MAVAVPLAFVALTRVAAAAEAEAGEAPFGLAWGRVTEVPLVLVICRDEGQQQVIWIGLPLSGKILAKARQAIHDEGVRRYGEPSPGPTAGSEIWPGGRALSASRRVAEGRRELVMTAFGPDYVVCSGAHRAATGHPAGAHVADLMGLDEP